MKILFAAILACSMTHCVTPAPQAVPKPIDAFQGYTQALMEGDVQTAYQFLGENIRSSLSVQAFERLYSKHGNAMQKEAMMLLAGMQEAVQKDEVWVSLGEHRAHLVRTKDGWRLTGVLQKSPAKDGATSEAAP